MSVGEFPLPKTDMFGIPCDARPKTGRGGGKRPRTYMGIKKGKKVCHLEKKNFCRLENQNVGWKKNLSVEKKRSVGEFPLPKTDMSGMSRIPCNARPNNGRGGEKNNLGPIGGKKKKKSSSFGKKRFFVGWKNKMLVGRKTCRLKKKCRLENFAWQKRRCPECP